MNIFKLWFYVLLQNYFVCHWSLFRGISESCRYGYQLKRWAKFPKRLVFFFLLFHKNFARTDTVWTRITTERLLDKYLSIMPFCIKYVITLACDSPPNLTLSITAVDLQNVPQSKYFHMWYWFKWLFHENDMKCVAWSYSTTWEFKVFG